jgi:phosphoesterase RecJ-like protein
MFSNSSPRAYRIVAELVEKHGLNVGQITGHIYRSKTPGRVKLEALVAATLQTRLGGKIAVARVTRDMLRKTGSTDADANELVTIPNSLKGAMIALLFRETGPRELKVSFRSEGQMAVNDIAAKFRGGGHMRAAGAHIKGKPVAVAEREVVAAVEKALRATLKKTGGAIIA